MAPILGIYASQMSGHLSTNNFSSIATLTASESTSVTFSSIPQTYTHLQIRMFEFESSTGINPRITFNGDGTGSYSWHYMIGNGSTVTAGSSASYGGFIMDQVQSTTLPNNAIVDILDYTNTNKYKTGRWLQGYDKNGSGNIGLFSGNWRNTAAITSITISDPTFASGTQFALYGIK